MAAAWKTPRMNIFCARSRSRQKCGSRSARNGVAARGGPRIAGVPAMRGPPLAATPFLADREPHFCRDLLRAQKIFMRGVFQAAAMQADQTLVAAHVGALVDGHREMTVAQQRP